MNNLIGALAVLTFWIGGGIVSAKGTTALLTYFWPRPPAEHFTTLPPCPTPPDTHFPWQDDAKEQDVRVAAPAEGDAA